MKRIKVEIKFPFPIEVASNFIIKLENLINKEICEPYEVSHPDRVMWPSEYGSKITYLPLTQEEEKLRGMEFDDSIFSITICERRKYHGM